MSAEVHAAIIAATNKLLETQSVGELTIKGIAKAAGVSRPAIYRRWSNPREVVLDSFLESASRRIPVPSSGDPIEAFSEHVYAMVCFMQGRGGRIIAELIGEGQSDSEMLNLFRERFLADRRARARALIERGILEGAFKSTIDIEFVIDLYAGAIYHRALLHHGELDDDFAEMLVKSVLQIIGTK